jgi:hypothetical protein
VIVGELVEPFHPAGRDAVPYGYWLILASGAGQRPEVRQATQDLAA